MAKSINRYFHFLASSKGAKPSGRLWYPAADVYQTPDGWLVKVELAGVSAEDVEIDIQGNVLYIAGCRRDKSCSVGLTYQQMEITYSRFEKTLSFPASIDGAHIEHNFDNGLLIIHLKKGA
ncbi:MAG: Hsp20/alpha crystallin family protein [Pyrinomonadaceae bacterium]|nr:Hsp20/alpha crystallin family protein [Pyrinomonadaceae bacterium]